MPRIKIHRPPPQGTPLQSHHPAEEQRQRSSGEGSFLLHLRTKFYNDLFSKFHHSYNFPEQRVALEENLFHIASKSNQSLGISVHHKGENTNISLLDDSEDSYSLFVFAAYCFAQANQSKQLVNGVLNASHYKLSFSLHADSLEEIERVLIALNGVIDITNFYYTNGTAVSDEDIKEIYARLQHGFAYNYDYEEGRFSDGPTVVEIDEEGNEVPLTPVSQPERLQSEPQEPKDDRWGDFRRGLGR